MIVDSFAGGGGASLGITWALGRAPDYAINHDEAAIEMHRTNHPETVHFCESVWKVDPRDVVGNGSVQLAWFSPDCTHFSIARGSKPVSPRVRGLAWIVIKWAKLPAAQRPRVIILENVKEFRTWGPLVKKRDERGKIARDSQGRELEVPCPRRKGVTFKRWLTTLRNLGYEVEWRELDAADYGAPTHRRRFFLIARCDGKRIVWPQPTHGDPRKQAPDMFGEGLKPYRTAAECIDWSLPCPSIFLTKEDAAEYRKFSGQRVNRPLKAATEARIANGLLRHVLRAQEPYLVDVQNATWGGTRGVKRPMQTVTAKPKGGGSALVMPMLIQVNHGRDTNRSQSGRDPLPTVTAKHGYGAAAVYLAQFRQRDARHATVQEPVSTIVSDGGRHAQVTVFVAKHYGGVVGVGADNPMPTTTTRGTQNQIVAASMVKLRGTSADGQPLDRPGPTISAQGQHEAVCMFYGTKYYRTARGGQSLDEPAHTTTSRDRLAVNSAVLARAADEMFEDGVRKVRAFIAKYLGHLDLTEKERLGIVTINGEDWQIVFIGMRMLTPRELARCQGFPDDYVLTGTKTSQVARIGNSVPPQTVEALVRANVGGAA